MIGVKEKMSKQENEFIKAKKGREYWLALTECYGIDQRKFVVVCPDMNLRDIELVKASLDDFLDKKSAVEAVILLQDKRIFKGYKGNRATLVECTCEEIENLMEFYCLYEFAPNIIFASLVKPPGRKGLGLEKKEELTYETLFKGIVFGLLN